MLWFIKLCKGVSGAWRPFLSLSATRQSFCHQVVRLKVDFVLQGIFRIETVAFKFKFSDILCILEFKFLEKFAAEFGYFSKQGTPPSAIYSWKLDRTLQLQCNSGYELCNFNAIQAMDEIVEI